MAVHTMKLNLIFKKKYFFYIGSLSLRSAAAESELFQHHRLLLMATVSHWSHVIVETCFCMQIHASFLIWMTSKIPQKPQQDLSYIVLLSQANKH